MSFTQDLEVRKALQDKLITLGNQQAGEQYNLREYDLTRYSGYGFINNNKVQIVQGESSTENMLEDYSWIEFFLTKSPQFIITSSEKGYSRKSYIFTLWIKTPHIEGVVFNEAMSSLVEEHFENNEHLPLPDGSVVTVLKTYQQATITRDSSSGRYFNRVFIECENYYNNNN